MALRPLLRCLPVAALAAWALAACKDGDAKDDAGAKTAQKAQPSLEQLTERCAKLGKACGEKDKHQEKITEECTQAAKSQIDKGCGNKAVALYDCYEKEICSDKTNKVWAIDDFRVLADRNNKCTAERNAGLECIQNAK